MEVRDKPLHIGSIKKSREIHPHGDLYPWIKPGPAMNDISIHGYTDRDVWSTCMDETRTLIQSPSKKLFWVYLLHTRYIRIGSSDIYQTQCAFSHLRAGLPGRRKLSRADRPRRDLNIMISRGQAMSLTGRTFRTPADQTVDYYKIGSSRPTWTRTKPSGTDRADISFQSYIHIFGFKW